MANVQTNNSQHNLFLTFFPILFVVADRECISQIHHTRIHSNRHRNNACSTDVQTVATAKTVQD
jgi:hypothetical protein